MSVAGCWGFVLDWDDMHASVWRLEFMGMGMVSALGLFMNGKIREEKGMSFKELDMNCLHFYRVFFAILSTYNVTLQGPP